MTGPMSFRIGQRGIVADGYGPGSVVRLTHRQPCEVFVNLDERPESLPMPFAADDNKRAAWVLVHEASCTCPAAGRLFFTMVKATVSGLVR